MEPKLSINRYQRVLQTFYGFYAPVEASLVRLTASGPPLGFPLRARRELIASDLHARTDQGQRRIVLRRRCRGDFGEVDTFPYLARWVGARGGSK
jgi:hypothetical protein